MEAIISHMDIWSTTQGTALFTTLLILLPTAFGWIMHVFTDTTVVEREVSGAEAMAGYPVMCLEVPGEENLIGLDHELMPGITLNEDFWYAEVTDAELDLAQAIIKNKRKSRLFNRTAVSNEILCDGKDQAVRKGMALYRLALQAKARQITTVEQFVSQLIQVSNEDQLKALVQTVHPWIVNQFYGGNPRGLEWTQKKLQRIAA